MRITHPSIAFHRVRGSVYLMNNRSDFHSLDVVSQVKHLWFVHVPLDEVSACIYPTVSCVSAAFAIQPKVTSDEHGRIGPVRTTPITVYMYHRDVGNAVLIRHYPSDVISCHEGFRLFYSIRSHRPSLEPDPASTLIDRSLLSINQRTANSRSSYTTPSTMHELENSRHLGNAHGPVHRWNAQCGTIFQSQRQK